MEKKTFLKHLGFLRQSIIYLLMAYLVLYVFLLFITCMYNDKILDYIFLCTGLKNIYYTGIYDKFLFPFLLSYYGAIAIILSTILIILINRFVKKKLWITLICTIFVLLNWYFVYIYILPRGTKLIFKDILHLESSSNIVFLPQLTNILHTMIHIVICGFVAFYVPVISGILINTFNKLERKKSFFIMSFIIVSGIIAPSDPFSHIVMALTMITSFQIVVFYGKISRRWRK